MSISRLGGDAEDLAGFIQRQVASYRNLEPEYKKLAAALKKMLDDAAKERGITAFVQARAKAVASFAEKCVRKRAKYVDPANQFTDLCGVRVIVESTDQIEPICDFIEQAFDVDVENSEDVAERLAATQFGYRSVHYIVSLKAQRSAVAPSDRSDADRDETGGAVEDASSPRPGLKAEVQVRTLLQHAWASLLHDRLYKTELRRVPRNLMRESGLIAATLENADAALARLTDALDAYRSCYGGFLSEDEFHREMEVLRTTSQQDPDNVRLAHRIAQLALAKGDARRAWETLRPFAQSQIAAVRRDLGVACWKLAKSSADSATLEREGWGHLEESLRLDENDVDARCALGDACFDKGREEQAQEHFRAAFRIAPNYPRALRGYVQGEILTVRQFDFLSGLRPNIEAAITTSLERARAGMHLPHAFYDMGFFFLVLDLSYDGLLAYTQALLFNSTAPTGDAEIEAERRKLARVGEVARSRGATLQAGFCWAETLLELAGRARQQARSPSDDSTVPRSAPWEPHSLIPGAPLRLRQRPVVIVAGGCHLDVQREVEMYRAILERAFEGFAGTIISGGTTAGVPGLVGDLRGLSEGATRVGVLPEKLPEDVKSHPGYDQRLPSGGERFTAADALTVWRCIFDNGIRAKDVRLLGINGGKHAAVEYRLALVLGAKVGILRDSGREATLIAEDPDWAARRETTAGNGDDRLTLDLALLPSDPETVACFIQPPANSESVLHEVREVLAEREHEEYRRSQTKRIAKMMPALEEWKNLDHHIRYSNLALVDHILTKLRRIGLDVRDKGAASAVVLYQLTQQQVAILAEMEHGRFNAERLGTGWRLDRGAKGADWGSRVSPYLVAWSELPADIRQYDLDTVASLPEKLREFGFEIYESAAQGPAAAGP